MKMIHKLFIFIISNIIFSAPVDLDKATMVTNNIIKERFPKLHLDQFTISHTETIKSDNIDLIYLFHLYPLGFVLIPKDDRVTPLLAYSHDSDFISKNMPENLSYILMMYLEHFHDDSHLLLNQKESH